MADVWALMETTSAEAELLAVFVDAHAGLSWLIHKHDDHPDVTWSREQTEPDRVKIIGWFPPLPGTGDAGWSHTYELERMPVLEWP